MGLGVTCPQFGWDLVSDGWFENSTAGVTEQSALQTADSLGENNIKAVTCGKFLLFSEMQSSHFRKKKN